jgi:hypothetical protein
VPFGPLDPGSGMGKKIRIRIRYEQAGSYLRELKKQFFGLKYLNSLMRIRDGKIRVRDPGWKKFGSGMKIFGSGINIPYPQHWLLVN